MCERFALIRPDISFRLISQGKELLHMPGNNDPISALYCIYGKQIVDQCIPVNDTFGELEITGFAGKPEIAKGSRADQVVFVNDRIIRSKVISSAIDEAYKTMLMKGRYAFLILNIRIPSQLLDVNVHPQKAEVRFWNDSDVFRAVFHTLQNALLSVSHVIEPRALFSVDDSTGEKSINEEVIISEGNEKKAEEANYDPSKDMSKKTSYSYPKQSGIDSLSDSSTQYQKDAAEKGQSNIYMPAKNPEALISDDDNALAEGQNSGLMGFTVNDLLEARIIGVAFATYILLEVGKNLILLDQHAAHEKILFEKLLQDHKQKDTRRVRSQSLLVPVILTLPPADMLFLEEVNKIMLDAGFAFESMGGREVILREVPDIAQSFQPESAFRNTLDSLKNEIPKTDEALLLLLATSACKAAVKGHDRLDELEIKRLITDLSGLNNPYHCPHGRPIIIRIAQKDLEKEFKRIV
jgi:DNA mismatch repair protein MutL